MDHGSLAGDAESFGDDCPGRTEIASALYFFLGNDVNGFTQLTQRIEGIAGAVEIRTHGVFGGWCG